MFTHDGYDRIGRAFELPLTFQKRAFGVTRIARITGLDRTGVEVCSAIRPHGHVLQVTNGKGRDLRTAAAAALSEAAELWAAENVRTHELKYGSRAQLTAAGLRCLWPKTRIEDDAEHLFMGWSRATQLGTKDEVWVPAHVVHCPRPGVFLGPRVFRWTSNGLAAHRTRDEAILHALREVIERDQLAFTFPDGWTPDAARRRVAPPPELKPLCEQIESAGFELMLFDAEPQREDSLGVPVAAALLFDKEEGPIPMTAGYGCAANLITALESAILEAAQSRLTDIHGAREDVQKDTTGAANQLREWMSARPAMPVNRERPRKLSTRAELEVLSDALRYRGFSDIAVVDLANDPLFVVRVVVRNLELSELL